MSTDELQIKADKDFSSQLDVELPEIAALQLNDREAALEKLLLLEKRVRLASDLPSSQRVLKAIVQLLHTVGDWKRMIEMVQVLSKKHGQLKMAIKTLVQEVISCLDTAPDLVVKVQTIEELREISAGKIFLELERARITRTLARITREQGDVAKAAELMGELQIETLGNMDLHEKTEFILEQMELYIAKKDFNYAEIVSRKILPKYFNDPEVADQKLKFYQQNIEVALHNNAYLDVCRYFRHIYDTEQIARDEQRHHEVLQNMIIFAILAPYDNLQNDILHKLQLESGLQVLPVYEQLVQVFTVEELVRWPRFQEGYGDVLRETWVFNPANQAQGSGETRWSHLKDRVIEHNLRVIAKFYSRITIDGLSELLDLNRDETEHFLAKLITNGTVFARVDRPKRLITFMVQRETAEVLNEWSNNTSRLLAHVERIGHLIAKEEMLHGIRRGTA